ncbi:MAG: DUF1360 domain-containing protein, partial [Chloroflexi bacterium]|nr:DUF1360 domain-containing protein [Chloroflexota bacterium]
MGERSTAIQASDGKAADGNAPPDRPAEELRIGVDSGRAPAGDPDGKSAGGDGRDDGQSETRSSVFAEYGQPDWPMGAYIGLVGTYVTAVTSFIVLAQKSGVQLPERISPADVLLLAIATQKFSRLLTKEWVLAPLRAPFTEYEGPGGPAEVREKPRGTGLQLALGELLTCPWCASQWTATVFTCGLLVRPRLVRLL